MSGGSYEYLFLIGTDEIGRHIDQVERMADRLGGLGYAQDAARETESVMLLLRQFEVRMSVRLERLSSLWRAVELWDSGDSGEDDVKRALLEFRCDLRMRYDRAATEVARAEGSGYGRGTALYRVYRMGEEREISGPIPETDAIAMLEEAAGGPV